jgi:hypothetical protein
LERRRQYFGIRHGQFDVGNSSARQPSFAASIIGELSIPVSSASGQQLCHDLRAVSRPASQIDHVARRRQPTRAAGSARPDPFFGKVEVLLGVPLSGAAGNWGGHRPSVRAVVESAVLCLTPSLLWDRFTHGA